MGRPLGVTSGLLKRFLLLAAIFWNLAESGVAGDFNTPNFGFCFGSNGTRDDPSGLTRRLRSVFLNSTTRKGQIVDDIYLNMIRRTGEHLYASSLKNTKLNCQKFISNFIPDSTQNIELKPDFSDGKRTICT